ncbi:MAG: hypothetical protein R3D55_20570 [Chloroflexota bacterium]
MGVEVVDLPLRTPQAATTTNPPVTNLPTVSGIVRAARLSWRMCAWGM